MMTIALPMTLLLACGGGGGNAATTSPAETSETRGNPDIREPVFLPGYAIRNFDAARGAATQAAPVNIPETQIVSAIQTRAATADTFKFSNFIGRTNVSDVNMECSNNSSCSGFVPDFGNLTFSLAGIEELSLVDDRYLMDFVFESESAMTTNSRRITMIQSQSAGRQRDGTRLSFQTYGGWLTDSVFGVELLRVTEGATPASRFASFSFGKASGSNPHRHNGSWYGAMVGADIRTGHIVQGRAIVTMDFRASGSGEIRFSNIINLNTGNSFPDDIEAGFSWNNGAFNSAGITNMSGRTGLSMLEGSFYGDNNEAVGGIFRSHNDILGAFGAKEP